MPYNGSGTFEAVPAPDFPAVSNEIIYASRFNTVINDLINNGLTKALVRDGQSTPTADLPMGGFHLTNLAAGSADNDSVRVAQAPIPRGSIGAGDWNSLTSYGLYEATAASLTAPAANFPIIGGTELGQLLVLPQGANTVQAYFTSDAVWSRRLVTGVWTGWDQSGSKPSVDGVIDLGSTTKRWQIAHVEGVNFPAAQSPIANANTLDDYEEGSWTPAITSAVPGDLAITYADRTGRYTKIGNKVTIHCDFTTSSFTHSTASGDLQITGAPFTPAAVITVGALAMSAGTFIGTYGDLQPIAGSPIRLLFTDYVVNDFSFLLIGNIASGTTVRVILSLTYEV